MAIISLHAPGTDAGRLPVGNYLDLSTQEVGYASSLEELENVIEKAPTGAILATTGPEGGPDNKLNVAFVGRKYSGATIDKDQFNRARLKFDRMTYENADAGKSVDKLDWKTLNLGNPDTIGIGARMVIRFQDNDGQARYFRILMQGVVAFDGKSYSYAFKDVHTALQFEELKPQRIIVPLGLAKVRGGYVIATSEDLPGHSITKETSELMWTIRPRGGRFHGGDYYFRNFPVVRVDFREARTMVDGEAKYAEAPPRQPPPWISSVVQGCQVAPSYLNSTYSIVIRHGIKVSDIRPSPRSAALKKTGTPLIHSYKYDLYLADGSTLNFREYDPPVDVEDEL